MVLVACLLCKPCVSCEGKEESRRRKPPTPGLKPHAPGTTLQVRRWSLVAMPRGGGSRRRSRPRFQDHRALGHMHLARRT
ncbi:unnamed protein product [Musa hybrid cultivar]